MVDDLVKVDLLELNDACLGHKRVNYKEDSWFGKEHGQVDELAAYVDEGLHEAKPKHDIW